MATPRVMVLALLEKYKYLLTVIVLMLAGNMAALYNPIWLIPPWVEYTPIIYTAISFAWAIPFAVWLRKKLLPRNPMSVIALCALVIGSVWTVTNMLYGFSPYLAMAQVYSENCEYGSMPGERTVIGCTTYALFNSACSYLFEPIGGLPFMRYLSATCLF